MIALPLILAVIAVPAMSLPGPAGGVGGGVGGHGGDHYNEKPDPFHFKYGVHDDKYYTDFSEERYGDEVGNIKGEYHVHLPDGRVQHVIYHADGNYGGTIMEAGVEPGVALPADHLVTVVLLGQDTKRGLNDSSTQTQHQVKSRLLLNVVV